MFMLMHAATGGTCGAPGRYRGHRHRGHPSPAAARPNSITWSVCSSTLLCCEHRSRPTRRSRTSSPRFAKATSARSSTPTLPFERLVDALDPERSTSHTPLFQILIEFRNNALPQLELPGLSVSGVEFDLPVAKFDLQLSVTERYDADGGTDGIDAEFIYATDLFDGDLIDSFSRRLLTILEAVSREPSTSTGDIDVVSADERRQMLTEWNTHAEPAPADNIADRFFEAVGSTSVVDPRSTTATAP